MFSIIIPVKELNDYIRETVPRICDLDRDDWELLIVTNEPQISEWQHDPRVKMLHSGRVGPADKRDLGARFAEGEYLVFLDDDSYPESNLLTIAHEYFVNGEVAIGGPAITPINDSFLQKISGAVFSSRLTGGSPERYRSVGSPRPVNDWPSVNLMVRKDVFFSIGGFDSPYWPGEDTFLCLKLFKNGHHVMYVPELTVWHHRREGFFRHLKQVGAYGLHRGYFARHLPATSRRIKYFAPSAVFVLFVLLILAPIFPDVIRNMLLTATVCYLFVVIVGIIDLMRFESKAVSIAALPYVIGTHISYGFYFLKGFFLRQELVSKLR